MATFKSKMKFLDDQWADKIWEGCSALNEGAGGQWRLPLAVLAITGARPASLERGVSISAFKGEDGFLYLQAVIPGAKILKNPDGSPRRGQDMIRMAWRLTGPNPDIPPRSQEFMAIRDAYIKHADQANEMTPMVISYGADAIASSVRMLSKSLWPRRKYHVSPICYRELFSSNAKAAGIPPDELAQAMGHLSAESQGKYASRPRKSGGSVSPKKLFSAVSATSKVKTERAPMARFKAATSLKKRLESKVSSPSFSFVPTSGSVHKTPKPK